jgi:hypothetical protein
MYCEPCRTNLTATGHHKDGSTLHVCGKCGGRKVSHRCHADAPLSVISVLLFPLTALFYAYCPQCKVVYNLGEFIEPVNPSLAEWLKKAAVVGLVVAILDALTNEPKKKRKRRR